MKKTAVCTALTFAVMLFNSLCEGGVVHVVGATQLPDYTSGTMGSTVQYRDLTLNKNIGNTVLDVNGEYSLDMNIDPSGINDNNTTINYNAKAFGNNIVIGNDNVKNINVYNSNGQKVSDVKFSSQNGKTIGSFDPSKLSSGIYFFNVNMDNGENIAVKTNIFEGQLSGIPSINDNDVKSNVKNNGKSLKTMHDIQVKITAPAGEYKAFCDTLQWDIPAVGSESWEYPYHYLSFNDPVIPRNYFQGKITEMMTGNPIANLPVKFVKMTEKNPFGDEYKFNYNVLAQATTDVDGNYKTPNAVAVQDSVFAIIGTKDDEWMDTEVPDFHYADEGLVIPDSLEHDYDNIVFTKMDGFVSYVPMHATTDSIEVGRYGNKGLNYALFPNWNNIAVRDTTGTDYINEADVVAEQTTLGKPMDKLRNMYYIIGREKCSAYVRNKEPMEVYFLPDSVNSSVGFNEERIERGKEYLLQASMLEKGLTREEALSYPDGFGGRYKIITEDPMITGGDGLHVKDGPNVYHNGIALDNPSEGYNHVGIDYGNYAETRLEESNKNAAQKEMTSNVARDYTAYTIGLANTMTSGFKKVDQMFIPMETMFYQKQKTGENNATMRELVGEFFKFDYLDK